GSGGNITLAAGGISVNHPGNLQLTGSVTANGVGTGNGGIANLSYNDPSPSATFGVGTAAENNFVSGSIHVDATGTGTGGQVSITNTASSELAINLQSTISAGATNPANVGLLNFFKSGQPVSIVGPGTLVGGVLVSGSQLFGSVCCITLLIKDIHV